MLFKNLILSFFFVFLSVILSGQNYLSLNGIILNEISQEPIVGAEINLNDNVKIYSDSTGQFILKQVPVGRNTIFIFKEGFTYYYNQSLLLELGNQDILEVTLSPKSFTGDTVFVTESQALDEINNQYVISVEETDRYPATFFDPARLVQTFPGVIAVNDQANHIAVRGQSPNLVTWRLQGLEIVNPNHTNNAGTFTDQPTVAGGGVNMISAQLLKETQFYNGYMPSAFGNAMGGTINMDFKKGNMNHWEMTSQIGLIGLELGAEGPLIQNKASLVANYRYSAVGALTGLGVDFGGEEINYQDASLMMDFKIKNGNVKLFGIWGNSKNIFSGNPDTIETYKDLFNIDFMSDIGIAGITFSKYWSNISWNSGVAYSKLNGARYQNLIDDHRENSFGTELYQTKLSFDTHVQSLSRNNQLIKMGLKMNRQVATYGTFFSKQVGANEFDFPTGFTVSPYIEADLQLSPVLNIDIGSRLVFSNNFRPSLEPNVQLTWNMRRTQSAVLSTSVHRQLEHPAAVKSDLRDRTMPLSLHHQVGYHLMNDKNYFKVLLFYQHGYFNFQSFNNPSNRHEITPVDYLPHSTNWFSELQFGTLGQINNEGQNYQQGIELGAKKFLFKSIYGLLNVSLFDSKYREDQNSVWLDTRWNQNFVFNAAFGKEFTWLNKRNKSNLLGMNIRFNGYGGIREPNIDVQASQEYWITIYDFTQGFINQNKAVFRTDLRVYWRRNLGKHSGLLSLDIQNVTNTKNEAYHYYDPYYEEIATQYQLGIIPILSYKYYWSNK